MDNKLKLEHFEKQMILACKNRFNDVDDGTTLEHLSIIITEVTDYYDKSLSGVYYFITEIIKKMKFDNIRLIEAIEKDIDRTYNILFSYNGGQYDKLALLNSLVLFISSRPVLDFNDSLGEPDYEYFKKAKEVYLRLKEKK